MIRLLMFTMQTPPSRRQSHLPCFLGEDRSRGSFGEEEVEGEDCAHEDDDEVLGPSPAQVGFGYSRSDDGRDCRTADDADSVDYDHGSALALIEHVGDAAARCQPRRGVGGR